MKNQALKTEHHERFTQAKQIENIKSQLQNAEEKFKKAEKLRQQ